MDHTEIKKVVAKYKPVVMPVTVAISSLIITVLLIIPQLLSFFTTQDEIRQVYQRAEILEAKANELESSDALKAQASLQAVKSIMPQDPDIPTAVVILSDLASKSSLLLDGISYLPPGEANKTSFRLSVRVSGSLNNIRAFILSLKDASRIFQVETISMRTLPSNRVEAEIPVAVYFGPVTVHRTAESIVPTLTSEEQNLLSKIENLAKVQPSTASSTLDSSITTGRPNPFE